MDRIADTIAKAKSLPPHKRHREPTKNWQRRMKALDMRKLGLDYHQIAERLGYSSVEAARGAVNVALRSVEVEGVEDFRRVHMGRLEALIGKVWPKMLEGDAEAIRTGLAIMERQAKLMGLDLAKDVLNIANLIPPPEIRFVVEGQVRELSAPNEAKPPALEVLTGHTAISGSK